MGIIVSNYKPARVLNWLNKVFIFLFLWFRITIDNLVMSSRSSIDMYYYFIQYKIKQTIYLYFN